MTGNGEDAEDLVQEAMLRLWKRRDSLDASDNIKALLYTILRNAFYDDRRRQQRHPSAELSEGDTGFEERGVETLDEMALIRNIVEHLPSLQRQLFRMKEIEGYDAGEIMQITGCTADNLRKNLSRARLMKNDINDNRTAHIAELLEKYIGGETTMAEEDFLRTYFREHSGDIPAEWKPYMVMFCFVDAERKTVRDETGDIAAETKPEIAGKTVGLHRKVALWLSAAAAVALLLVFFLPSHQSDAVCYMVEDGKVYTDKRLVHAEAAEALRNVGEMADDDPFEAMRMMR